jgi:DNA-3-methyladenine glycosylase II
METFALVPRGPFSLAASIRFLEGFAPAAYTGPDSPGPAGSGPEDVALELAFPVEGSWQTAGVRVSQDGGGVTAAIVSPKSPEPDLTAAVRRQVERILSLDVDGSDFPGVGERDAVVADLQRRYPGLRPVGFWSPYEAAAWTIIGHRIRVRQAAAIKLRMAKDLGEPVTFGDRAVHAFPAPARLAGLDAFPGLSGRKPEWLRSVARAALDGQLDAARLRGLPREAALSELKRLPGIGDFSATLILLRGAGDPDAVPGREPRLARAVALAYGLPGPATPEQLLRISENWKPYRTWVTLLMRTLLEDQTGEIAGRRDRGNALSWGQHVVASRVPPVPASTAPHNQGGRDRTERRRDPGPWPRRPVTVSGEHLTG